MKDQFKSVSGFAQQHACKSIDPTEEYIRLPTRIVGKLFSFIDLVMGISEPLHGSSSRKYGLMISNRCDQYATRGGLSESRATYNFDKGPITPKRTSRNLAGTDLGQSHGIRVRNILLPKSSTGGV